MVKKPNIQDLYDVSSKTSVSLPKHKQNNIKLTFNNDPQVMYHNNQQPILPFAASSLFDSHIIDWRQLTAPNNTSKTVYEVSFDIKHTNIQYRPGDTIGVIPQNDTTEVDTVINHLGLEAQADLGYEICLETDNNTKPLIPPFVPIKATIRHVLTNCLDLRAIVKKLFLLALSKYTKNESERKILEYLCSKEGSTMYNTFVMDQSLCILDIFSLLKSCKPPIEVLMMNLPRLLPRPYSIACCQKVSKNILKISFSVIKLVNNRRGLITGYLEDLILNDALENNFKLMTTEDRPIAKIKDVKMYLRSNTNGFRLPETKQRLLLIGAGTGISPFLGFLEEINSLKEINVEVGDIWLIFGCRDPELDFIYERELKEFLCKDTLTTLDLAFSRKEYYNFKYVQDVISHKGEAISKYVDEGAMIFVCGDLKTMALGVREALESCFVKHNGKSNMEAKQYFDELVSTKRYITDIWS